MNSSTIITSSTTGKGKETFRFQNRRCLLTYKTHIDKKAYCKWMVETKKREVSEIYLAHENGDETNPYEHTHVLIDFGKRFQTTNCRFFDYSEIHPHIKKVDSIKHWQNSLVYLAKEDPECKFLLDLVPAGIVDLIMDCSTETEAMTKFVKKPNDVFGVKAIFACKEREIKEKVLIKPKDRFDWEKVFLKISYRQGPSDRAVNWLYDKRGRVGKTVWAHHMIDCYGDSWRLFNFTGNERDFYHLVKVALDDGWNGYGMIIDIPRSYNKPDFFYSCLEKCLDGRMTSSKYNGGFLHIGKPHVWVFSNTLPDVKSMSVDRWRIIAVGKYGKGCALLKWNPGGKYTIEDCRHGVVGYSFFRSNCGSSSSSCGLFYGASYEDSTN